MKSIKSLSPQQMLELTERLELTPTSRNSIFIQIIKQIGIRPSEALLLTKHSLVDTADHPMSLWIDALKGSVSRYMPLSPRLYARVKQLADSSATDQLFDFGYNYAQKIWYELSPESCRGHTKATALGMHSLRHTFAIELYKKCYNIKLVQQCLGHKNIDNTLIYMTYVDSGKQVRAAMYGDE